MNAPDRLHRPVPYLSAPVNSAAIVSPKPTERLIVRCDRETLQTLQGLMELMASGTVPTGRSRGVDAPGWFTATATETERAFVTEAHAGTPAPDVEIERFQILASADSGREREDVVRVHAWLIGTGHAMSHTMSRPMGPGVTSLLELYWADRPADVTRAFRDLVGRIPRAAARIYSHGFEMLGDDLTALNELLFRVLGPEDLEPGLEASRRDEREAVLLALSARTGQVGGESLHWKAEPRRR